VSEQLRIDEIARDGAAIDPHEGPGRAIGSAMNLACHDLLAAARLAEQQHRSIRPGDLRHALHHVAQSGVGAHNHVGDLASSELAQERSTVGLRRFAQRRRVALSNVMPQRRSQWFDHRLHDST
jgi:hypothetical protein